MRSAERIAAVVLFALGVGGCGKTSSPPTPASIPGADASALPACRPDISAADCARAQAALQRDAEMLAEDMQALQAALPVPATDPEADVAAIRAKDCAEQREALAALQRMQRGEGERLDDEERAQLPAEIARVEARLATDCG